MNATPIDINALANFHHDSIKVSHRVCEEIVRKWKTYTSEYTTYDWLNDVENALSETEWKEFVALWLNATPQERKDWFRAATEDLEKEWDDEEDDSWEAAPKNDEEDDEECDWTEMPSEGVEDAEYKVAEWARDHIKEVAPHLKAQEELEALTEELEALKNTALRAVDAAWKTYNEKSEAIAKKMFHLKMAEQSKNKVLEEKIESLSPWKQSVLKSLLTTPEGGSVTLHENISLDDVMAIPIRTRPE